ncbi:hypothetical protein GGD46_004251 [Rhizobium lusitanum]|uniref:Uncharacterized protein n=1 Tax=Rhizobium lusitanum TaxID=293958 RepID=A0A7X0MDJ4_9HYPH|nr:hypothetical protein [Rhizobium lusitanum]
MCPVGAASQLKNVLWMIGLGYRSRLQSHQTTARSQGEDSRCGYDLPLTVHTPSAIPGRAERSLMVAASAGWLGHVHQQELERVTVVTSLSCLFRYCRPGRSGALGVSIGIERVTTVTLFGVMISHLHQMGEQDPPSLWAREVAASIECQGEAREPGMQAGRPVLTAAHGPGVACARRSSRSV